MNYKKVTFLLVGLLISTINLNAQNYNRQKNNFILANIGINGLAGGIGAAINKKPNEKIGMVLLKGFSQGCLGGGFNVLGKEITYQIKVKENIAYAWPARLTNAIGSSITQNAAANINFWEQLHFNVGVLRLDYNVPDRKLKARFLTSAVYGIGVTASQAKFNPHKSLQSGILIFERETPLTINGAPADGTGIVSSIGMNKNIGGSRFSSSRYHGVFAHEVAHIIQYETRSWLNPMFNKVNDKLKHKSSLYEKLAKYVYFDLNGPLYLGLYMSQINQPWECRFAEREADLFSNKRVYSACR